MAAYLFAALSKPSTIFLPPVLFAWLISSNKDKKETWMEQFKKIRGHVFIFTAFFIYYLLFKIMSRQAHDSLELSLWGGHIIKKAAHYIRLIPLIIAPWPYQSYFIAAVFIMLGIIIFTKKRVLTAKTFPDKYYIGFWISWIIFGMIPPCALVTNVIAEYYATYALCPVIVLLMLFIELFVKRLSGKEAVFKAIVFGMVITSFIGGTLFLREENKKGIFSVSVELRGAHLVKIIQKNIMK
ncbi:MAG: hypothetical protein ABII75_00190, partial [Candidatus Omnitrophota bacterium]